MLSICTRLSFFAEQLLLVTDLSLVPLCPPEKSLICLRISCNRGFVTQKMCVYLINRCMTLWSDEWLPVMIFCINHLYVFLWLHNINTLKESIGKCSLTLIPAAPVVVSEIGYKKLSSVRVWVTPSLRHHSLAPSLAQPESQSVLLSSFHLFIFQIFFPSSSSFLLKRW